MAVVTISALWKGIKPTQTYAPLAEEVPEWFTRFILNQYTRTAAQINAMQLDVQGMRVTGMAGGVAVAAVVLPNPYPDATYTITAMPDWNTTVFFSAQTKTGFTLNFGTVTPGAANNVYVHTIR